MTLKILMLGWELPPYHSGGLGVACYQLCKYLAHTGVEIDFMLPCGADYGIAFMWVNPVNPVNPRALADSGGLANVYESGTYRPGYLHDQSQPLTLMAQQDTFVEAVSTYAEQADFDILHAHDWLTFQAALAAKFKTGKPLVVHVHATEYDRSGGNIGNPFVRDIEYEGLVMADQVIAVSELTKRTIIEQYDIPAEKITVVYNRMDVVQDEGAANNMYAYLERMKSNGYRIVVSAGRLTIQKGLTHLMDAMKIVIEHNPKVLLLIVGSGEQYEELIEHASYLGIAPYTLFTGHLDGTGKAWRDSFRVGDLFVMPSVSEPFGLAALEAIGYGAPVLISKTVGVGETLHHVLSVDYWDVLEMANQIGAVMAHDTLRDELHQHSYQEYQQSTWSDAARQVTDIYQFLLGESDK